MIVIRVYAHGSGLKARLEQHLTCCQQGDCGQPDQETCERAYPPRGSSPRETVGHAAQALSRAWRRSSNVELLEALTYHETLPGL